MLFQSLKSIYLVTAQKHVIYQIYVNLLTCFQDYTVSLHNGHIHRSLVYILLVQVFLLPGLLHTSESHLCTFFQDLLTEIYLNYHCYNVIICFILLDIENFHDHLFSFYYFIINLVLLYLLYIFLKRVENFTLLETAVVPQNAVM